MFDTASIMTGSKPLNLTEPNIDLGHIKGLNLCMKRQCVKMTMKKVVHNFVFPADRRKIH